MTSTSLKPTAGQAAGAIQTMPANVGLQTTDRIVLTDLVFDGGSPLDAGSLIGLDIGNNACVVAERLVATGVKVGYRWQGMQFAAFRDVKAWNCGVGFYSKPIPDAGGNNSNSFYDPQAIGCMVGALFVLPPNAQYPNAAMYLRNFTALDNKVCGLAIIGKAGLPISLTVDGGCPEDTDRTGNGPATYTYDGYTVPKCSIYGSFTHLHLRRYEFAEAHLAVTVRLENSSVCVLEDCTGPGWGYATLCDATSSVIVRGTYEGAVQFDGVVRWEADFIGADALLIAGPMVTTPASIPNACTAPTTGDFNYSGQATITSDKAAVFGPGAGSRDANSVRFNAPASAGLAVMAFDVVSDVDREFVGLFYGQDASSRAFRLRAGERRRVVHVVPAMKASASIYVVFPQGAGPQATLRFSNWQTFFAPSDNPASRAVASQILRGGVGTR